MSNFIHELKISNGKITASVQGGSDLALLQDAGSPVKNLILNGNFDFWQRGTTFSVTNGADIRIADRFLADTWTSGQNITVSKSSDVPLANQAGFNSGSSVLITNNTGAVNSTVQLHHNIEGFDYQALHTKKARLQFWAKSSIAGTYSIGLTNGTQNRGYAVTYTINTASVWQKITIDIAMDNQGTWAFDNTIGILVWFCIASGTGAASAGGTISSNPGVWVSSDVRGFNTGATGATWSTTSGATFQIAEVMLTAGDYSANPSANLPFQRAGNNIAHELQLCQRYYEKSFETDTTPAAGSTTTTFSTNNGLTVIPIVGFTSGSPDYTATVPFKVQKRAAPTVTIFGTSNGAVGQTGGTLSFVTASLQVRNTNVVNIEVNQATDVGSKVYLFHWTADCDL